jgi:glycerol-3-phosphate dehydrogenase (NAD(P)+)
VAHLTEGAPVAFHPTRDIVGVEVAGAVANVASLAAGMAEGLGLGDTARGVLIARGIIESRYLGVALGASSETFTGLAGLGELIPSSVTSTDRHIEVGRMLADGARVDDALARVDGHVEGILTAQEAVGRARALNLELPLIGAVHDVISSARAARSALEDILARPLPLDRSS